MLLRRKLSITCILFWQKHTIGFKDLERKYLTFSFFGPHLSRLVKEISFKRVIFSWEEFYKVLPEDWFKELILKWLTFINKLWSNYSNCKLAGIKHLSIEKLINYVSCTLTFLQFEMHRCRKNHRVLLGRVNLQCVKLVPLSVAHVETIPKW